LKGFTALVTGGRLKIGFETALKLLRCGARVVVTTRFVDDALNRFLRQPDFDEWKDRLQVRAADFRAVWSVENLVKRIEEEFETLDILINNAAQTLRRPPAFYKHLIVDAQETTAAEQESSQLALQLLNSGGPRASRSEEGKLTPWEIFHSPKDVARLSQLILMPGDDVAEPKLFPPGEVDGDGQQVDRRSFNSWMMKLEEVHLVELLEVMYVNVVAPFLLCSRLKRIMRKDVQERPSFIVNVAAMEGNFFDPDKSSRHPHTNMAKAALNMMTRTSASDFRDHRIFMNSVDPGWITNEKPYPLEISPGARKSKMAIDEVDGAARVCDPIFRALNETDYLSGSLLKNYSVYPW
jgi:NAD(P)-dependent dehydrogenase (short-subunit alcohol dehydrogenase family)